MREDESPDWSWTEDADMPTDAELTRQVEAQTRVHHPLRPLSDHQLDVLRLLSHGGSYRTIAHELESSYEAVADVAKEIRRKLAAKTNEHAVAIAYRASLID